MADEVIVTTDDGSYGDKGLVTDMLANLFKRGEKIDRIICCGPLLMMRAVVEASRPKAIPITVSLNAILLDATGMCGSCRCTVAGKTRFSCVDGPEFDGYQVDFDELLLRNKRFLREEKKAMDAYQGKYPRQKQPCREPSEGTGFQGSGPGFTPGRRYLKQNAVCPCKKKPWCNGCQSVLIYPNSSSS
jgi:hypothetical protein